MSKRKSNFIVRGGADFSSLYKEMDKSQKKLSSFQKGISKSFKLVTTTLGALAIGRTAKSFLQTAARTETLGVAMDSVARSSGYATEALQEHKKAIMDKGIAEQESVKILNRFMQAQLDTADASRLARVAQDAAVIAGIDSSQAAEQMTEAIARQRPILLSQFGMTRNLNDIYKGYGKTLGKTTAQLTEAEKKQAMLNYILEEGEKITGTYEASMGTAGKQIGSLSRYWQTFQTTIATPFLPALAKGVEGVTNALKNATAWMEANTATLQRWGQTLADIIGLFVKTTDTVPGASSQTKPIQEQTGAIKDQGDAIEEASKKASNAMASFDALNILSEKSTGAGTGAEEGYEGTEIGAIATETSEVTKELTSSIDKIREAISPTTDALKRLWEEGLKPLGTFAFDNLKNFYTEFLKPVGKWVLGEGLPRLLDVLTNLLKDINWTRLTDAFKNLYKALAPFAKSVGRGLISFIETIADILKPAVNLAVEILSKSLENFTSIIKKIPPEIAEAIGGAIGGIVTAILMFKGATAIAGIVSGIGKSLGGMLGAIAAHPYMAIAAGIAALAGAILTFDKQRFSGSEIGKMVKSLENYNREVQEMLDKHEEQMRNIDIEHETVKTIADKYFELADSTTALTDEQRTMLVVYANQLADMTPEIEDLINRQTGAYKGTREEIEKAIEKSFEYLKVQAMQEQLIDLYKKQEEAKAEVKKAEELLIAEEEKNAELREKYSVDSNGYIKTLGTQVRIITDDEKKLKKRLEETKKAYEDNNERIRELEQSFIDNTKAVENYKREIKSGMNPKITITSNVDSALRDITAKVAGLKLPELKASVAVPSITGSLPRVPHPNQYASGGFPETGEMFVAREAGPELIGTIGSKTAVVNNDQIVESVASGVQGALMQTLIPALSSMKSSGGDIVLMVGEEEIARAVNRGNDKLSGRYNPVMV